MSKMTLEQVGELIAQGKGSNPRITREMLQSLLDQPERFDPRLEERKKEAEKEKFFLDGTSYNAYVAERKRDIIKEISRYYEIFGEGSRRKRAKNFFSIFPLKRGGSRGHREQFDFRVVHLETVAKREMKEKNFSLFSATVDFLATQNLRPATMKELIGFGQLYTVKGWLIALDFRSGAKDIAPSIYVGCCPEKSLRAAWEITVLRDDMATAFLAVSRR